MVVASPPRDVSERDPLPAVEEAAAGAGGHRVVRREPDDEADAAVRPGSAERPPPTWHPTTPGRAGSISIGKR
eukprot:560221-Prymnesium_polylepis.1